MSCKIYLAGPEVFLPELGRAVFEKKKEICRQFGFTGVSPADGAINLTDRPPFEQGVAIYRGNAALMREAQAVIANMTPFRGVGMDSGTAFEMGFMAALGKPVLGYTHVMHDFTERCRDYYAHRLHEALDPYSAGTAIERFEMADNLMMSGAVADHHFKVQAVAVPRGEELSSVAGFRLCVEELAKLLRASG